MITSAVPSVCCAGAWRCPRHSALAVRSWDGPPSNRVCPTQSVYPTLPCPTEVLLIVATKLNGLKVCNHVTACLTRINLNMPVFSTVTLNGVVPASEQCRDGTVLGHWHHSRLGRLEAGRRSALTQALAAVHWQLSSAKPAHA